MSFYVALADGTSALLLANYDGGKPPMPADDGLPAIVNLPNNGQTPSANQPSNTTTEE
ncbi:hypothetical protein CAL7716_101320 (plasmid) [Calothrix sp. PCC 7716]|nr:hypothetical protein CAL7716_101320 [Calothrix sp. PCC 7716]